MHDCLITGYLVACEDRRITLYLRAPDEKQTRVVFDGVVAHRFRAVMPGNIVFGIDSVDVEKLVRGDAPLFDEERAFGWPEVGRDIRDNDELISALRRCGSRGYEISSSYGLAGWVIAGSVRQIESTPPNTER